MRAVVALAPGQGPLPYSAPGCPLPTGLKTMQELDGPKRRPGHVHEETQRAQRSVKSKAGR